MRKAIVVAVWVLAGAAISAQNWPSFRGPDASGVADGHADAVKWNVATGENVLWKTPVPGVAVSSPIVWGDRVFVSTAVSSDPSAGIRTGPLRRRRAGEGRLEALLELVGARQAHGQGAVGTRRARRRAEDEAPPEIEPGVRRRRSPTAVASIVSFGSEGTIRVRLRRQARCGSATSASLNAGWFYDPDYEWGIASSPIIWKNLVIVQCDIQKNSFIAAFDVATGQPGMAHRPRGDPVVVDAGDFRTRRPGRAGDAGDDVHPRLRSGDRQGAVAAVRATRRSRFRRRSSDRAIWSS